jgi:hypothetical protein
MKACFILLFLTVLSTFVKAGQDDSYLASSKDYVKYIDSVWLALKPNEQLEEEMSLQFNVMRVTTTINDQTVTQWTLENLKGDTTYLVNYQDSRQKDVEETYYLKDNQIIAAQLNYKKGKVRYQKTLFYQNNQIIFEEAMKVSASSFKKIPSKKFPVKNFNHLKDILSDKKGKLLLVATKYFSDNYTILNNFSRHNINFYAKGDSFLNYFLYLTDVIHEGVHKYSQQLGSTDSYTYRLNDTLIVDVPVFQSLPAKTISNIIPPHFQQGRLRIYIFGETGTQGEGFLGILEEYVAYFQGLKTFTGSFYFLTDSFQFSRPEIWLDYLDKEDYITAINQFKLFISWYLQYVKQHDPVLFQRIVQDKGIKHLFTHVEDQSQRLIEEYLLHRLLIVKTLQPLIEKAAPDQRERYKNLLGRFTFLTEYFYTDNLLKQKEHLILDLLRY